MFMLLKLLSQATIGSATSANDMEQMEEDEAEKKEKPEDKYEVYSALFGMSEENPVFLREVFKVRQILKP